MSTVCINTYPECKNMNCRKKRYLLSTSKHSSVLRLQKVDAFENCSGGGDPSSKLESKTNSTAYVKEQLLWISNKSMTTKIKIYIVK